MQKTSAISAAVVAVVGVVLITIMIQRGSDEPAPEDPAEEAGALDYLRGPHGGRFLADGDVQLEVTIYETGVPPHFRVYPYDANRKPIPPRDVQLTIELYRLGGRVDRIGFAPESDYLRGEAVVEEPHSFDVRSTRIGTAMRGIGLTRRSKGRSNSELMS
ncbi:MAG: hypothetical protein HY650_13265 [Acidobacteria bacterium]|nr:hypothetical protein [Acidobacteriota bacterium]